MPSPWTCPRCSTLDSAAINVLVSHGGPLHIVANPMLIPVLRISGVAELATVRAARGQRPSGQVRAALVSASSREVARRYFLR